MSEVERAYSRDGHLCRDCGSQVEKALRVSMPAEETFYLCGECSDDLAMQLANERNDL